MLVVVVVVVAVVVVVDDGDDDGDDDVAPVAIAGIRMRPLQGEKNWCAFLAVQIDICDKSGRVAQVGWKK